MMLYFVLQTATDVREIISTNDATIIGILIGAVLGLSGAVVFLYRENRGTQKEYTNALKEFSEKLIHLTNAHNDLLNMYLKNMK